MLHWNQEAPSFPLEVKPNLIIRAQVICNVVPNVA